MKLIEKAKADIGEAFFNRMKAVAAATDTINDLESLSGELHKAGIPNAAHVCAHDFGGISTWISLYVSHIESVITVLQFLKELHYAPVFITDEGRGVNHGYRFGDIVISVDFNRFSCTELASALEIVFGQQEAEVRP